MRKWETAWMRSSGSIDAIKREKRDLGKIERRLPGPVRAGF
jgi:hypothetical protein